MTEHSDLPRTHSEDAHADDAPPTDAVTDEVREAAATAESDADELDPDPSSPAQS
ncbi:MAG: hypothetical protein ABW091_10580 [Microbacterium sp.]